MPKKKQEKIVPWVSIEKEYRAGSITNVDLARTYNISEGAIRKMTRKHGWTRDLQERVRERVRDKLVRTTAGTKLTAGDEAAVEAAARKALDVVISHRKDIQSLRDQEQRLLQKLGSEPTKTVMVKTAEGGTDPQEIALSLTEQASILRDLATVQAKRIELERQAYSLDDTAGSEEDEETIEITYYREVPFPPGV